MALVPETTEDVEKLLLKQVGLVSEKIERALKNDFNDCARDLVSIQSSLILDLYKTTKGF